METTLRQRIQAELGAIELPACAGLESVARLAAKQGPSADAVRRGLARALGVSFAENLEAYEPSGEFTAAIPIAFARQHKMLGLKGGSDSEPIVLALADAIAWQQVQVVARFLNRRVTPIFAPADAISVAINRAYQQRSGQAQDLLETFDRGRLLDEVRALGSAREDLLDNATRAPVIKLVNLILFEAAKANASDVHVQPYDDRLAIRTRIDGLLYDSFDLPKSVQAEVVSRLKVMGGMNIAEKRLSQDGRATVQVGERNIDLRIASLPTSFGERVVIRLLDKTAGLYDLTNLGMDSQSLARFGQLITADHGLILVTGPTGSGKSTTLYSALRQINSKEKNILTLEDPIEYQLEGISQTQVSEKKGMTFASGLRSVLRQDPDVIMVGEIRDHETATMAIQSSLTGHLVFSTLHTNDAASAVTRLLDLGIESYLVASSLVAVLAQRLVRRVCSNCAAPYTPTEAERLWLGAAAEKAQGLRLGTGCASCRGTGYRGRLGIFELLVVDDALRSLVGARATAAEMKDCATRAGMRLLRDDGVRKVLAGETTIPEVERVTMQPESSDAAPEVEPEMAVFTYTATDPASAEARGTITADTPRHARDLLRGRGLIVQDVAHYAPRAKRTIRTGAGRGRAHQLTDVLWELSTLFGVGVPLLEALDTVARQQRGRFALAVTLLRDRVAAGSSLASAMREQGAPFDELTVSITEVGEDAGTLDASLQRLAEFRERSQQLKGRIATALLYPALVLSMAIFAGTFLMTFVVPRIIEPLVEQGQVMPLPTRIVKGASDFLIGWGWLLLLLAAGAAAGFAVLLRNPRGKLAWHRLLLRLPLIGELTRKQAVVRMAVIISTLLKSGIVFLRAVQIAQGATSNLVLRDALARCERAVTAGSDIAVAMNETGAFAPMVVQIFALGQQSGRMEEMLDRLAGVYDQQVSTASQRLTAVLEPILIVLLALVVLLIVAATVLPILEAGNAIQ